MTEATESNKLHPRGTAAPTAAGQKVLWYRGILLAVGLTLMSQFVWSSNSNGDMGAAKRTLASAANDAMVVYPNVSHVEKKVKAELEGLLEKQQALLKQHDQERDEALAAREKDLKDKYKADIEGLLKDQEAKAKERDAAAQKREEALEAKIKELAAAAAARDTSNPDVEGLLKDQEAKAKERDAAVQKREEALEAKVAELMAIAAKTKADIPDVQNVSSRKGAAEEQEEEAQLSPRQARKAAQAALKADAPEVKNVRSRKEAEEPNKKEAQASPEQDIKSGLRKVAEAALAEEEAQKKLESRTPIPIANMSVLEYRACCGIGHRLGRQTAAYNAAHRLGWKLNVTWTGCDKVNVFDELFREESEEDLSYVTSEHAHYVIKNEVHGYYGPKNNFHCTVEDLESDYNMYSGLKLRFKRKRMIDAFVAKHFRGKFSIGIHIRAGNGETGDFTNKGRAPKSTPQNYTQAVVEHIKEAVEANNVQRKPPVLFIATDTARYLELFRRELKGIMPVVEWQQQHDAEGTGVFMGQHQKQDTPNEVCIQKWRDMTSDQLLLGSTDLLIAGQYSSFSQSMPFALVLPTEDDPTKKRHPSKFCEVTEEGMGMHCFSSKMGWCQERKHSNSLRNTDKRNGGSWDKFLKAMEDHKGTLYHPDRRATHH